MSQKIKSSLAYLFVAIIIQGCATKASKTENTLEMLFNPSIEDDSVVALVVSHGCTSEQNFKLEVTDMTIQIIRIKPDLCRVAPRLKEIEFEYDFVAGSYSFANSVQFISTKLQLR